MMRWTICLCLLTLLSSGAHAQDGMDGRWAWRVEGRTALLLDFEDDAESGRLLRLKHFTLDANAGYWRLIPQGQDVVSDPIVEQRRDGANWLFTVRNARDGEPTAYQFKVLSVSQAELSLKNVPGAPVFTLDRTEDTSLSDDWEAGRAYGQSPARPDNVLLARLFEEDQKARSDANGVLGVATEQTDAARRAQVRSLLDSDDVQSASDYYHAAFIFQHGDQPDDYLLAHALAVNALALGRPDGVWIAAASLDRYVQSIGRSQIYGTQFQTPLNGGATTQGLFDRELLPDAVRRDSGVPALSDQDRQRALFDNTP